MGDLLDLAEWHQRADVADQLDVCRHHVSKRLTQWTGTPLVERRVASLA